MLRYILLTMFIMKSATAVGAVFDHDQWNTLLRNQVVVQEGGKTTKVDYRGMAEKQAILARYLDKLTQVSREQFDLWHNAEQLAFLINAYNAWTVHLILTKYPDLQSIKDLGSLFQSPWKKKFFHLLGEKRSLDDLEHNLIRGSKRYNDPRIHFAVNCASIGCPALRNEAYSGEKLDIQLSDAAVLFLSDRSRNRLNKGKLEISSIFKWYREDFESGWRGTATLSGFLKLYKDMLGLNDTEADELAAGNLAFMFLDYDWQLNDVN
jgi:hypothetical protein